MTETNPEIVGSHTEDVEPMAHEQVLAEYWGPVASVLEGLRGTDKDIIVCTVDGDDTKGHVVEVHPEWLCIAFAPTFERSVSYWIRRETIARINVGK